jgi:hypothetical protein
VPQVTIIATRHAWLTHAFVLLADNLRHTRTTRRGVPLVTPALLIPASTSVAQALLPVPQVTIIAARHASLTHAFVLLGDNLRQTRTTRRGTPTNAVTTNPSLDFSSTGTPACAPSNHHRSSSCSAHNAFVLLADNLRHTRTTRRGVPLLTPGAASPMRPECGAEEPARQCDMRCDRR